MFKKLAFESFKRALVPALNSRTVLFANRTRSASAFSPLQHSFPLRQFYSDARQLDRLEREANMHPEDPNRQYALLKVLNEEKDPSAVVKRFDSKQYATNDACVKEYVKALVHLGRLDSARLTDIGVGREQEEDRFQVPRSQGTSAISRDTSEPAGSKDDPVYFRMAEPTVGSQIWKTLRFLFLGYLAFLFITMLLDDRGITNRPGGSIVTNNMRKEILPQKGQIKRFKDVVGVDEAKAELEEVVHFLKDPTKFTRLGGKMPKGLLLTGPPGTGKTILARAIAGESGVPFYYASGSEFDEMYVGVGARRVRDLFETAKKNSPCIIFIDEIDAIGATRNPKDQQYMRMTLNQLLADMDGFNPTDGIIVIGATNFPEVLDKALTRPGRFDRHIVVTNPDVKGRRKILDLHLQNMPLAPDVDVSVLARGTPGFSGADLANLANNGALRASTLGKDQIHMEDLEHAKDRILMGAERKSAVITEKNRRLTAFHEGGHAVVASFTPDAMPLHKATIIPRGSALGMVTQLPEEDQLNFTKKQMLARLDVCMGGRVAEELIFGPEEVTSGASSDLEQATKMARLMVERFGMSSKIGLVTVKDKEAATETRTLVDKEVRELCNAAYDRAKALLTARNTELHRVANALLENETLTAEEMKKILKGEDIKKK